MPVENPAWLSGGVEVMSNLTLPYNRIAIIVFAALVLAGVAALIARTRLGLFVRGVTQNRTMAACMGVNTARIDTYAFALGSGIAGLAGCALSQVGNVGPDLGQSYIVDSFMVVVLGGVGQLAGTVYAALGLGVLNKLLEGWQGAVLAKIMVLVFIVIFIQKRPQGIFAMKGEARKHERMSAVLPAPGAMVTPYARRPHRPRWRGVLAAVVIVAVLVPVLNLAVPAGSAFHLSDYAVQLVGKIMCYAICALAMDLIWGYTGILSLGHGLFFALGGYAMGMYLMRQIGRDGQYQHADARLHGLPRTGRHSPGTGRCRDFFVAQMLLVLLVPGLLAFVFGFFAFRSRIKGVYFSIITQALTYAAMLLFFRNETGFGGNNGFTDFKRILGAPIATPGMRMTLFVITGLTLIGFFVFARWLVQHQVRPRAAGHPRRREPRHVHRLRPGAPTS